MLSDAAAMANGGTKNAASTNNITSARIANLTDSGILFFITTESFI